MSYKFEMVQKLQDREITTRSNDVISLIVAMGNALMSSGAAGSAQLSGARGEIEIGVRDGQQVLLRVLDGPMV